MTGERQWLRACNLVVGKAPDVVGPYPGTEIPGVVQISDPTEGIDLSGLRIIFRITKTETETPNTAEIKIFNVAPEVSQQIGKEFSVLALQAGYEGNVAVIFTGDIRLVRRGKEQGTDTFVEIVASDGDAAYNFAVVSTTLAAGYDAEAVVAAAAAAMKPYGVRLGHVKGLKAIKAPRGKTIHADAKHVMRQTCKSSGCSWSIQNGVLQVLTHKGYLPGEAVELSGQTGLIGTPEQTIDGIKVRCLLNPRLKIGGRIHLDNASILLGKADPTLQPQQATSQAIKDLKKMPSLDRDGFYRILSIAYVGDTRGNEWYCETICVGLDASAPANQATTDIDGEEGDF